MIANELSSITWELKIGILDQSTVGWAAGATFTRMMLESLALVRDRGLLTDDVVFLGSNPSGGWKSIPVTESMNRSDWERCLTENAIDVVIPLRNHIIQNMVGPVVGWIPDLQHLRLPELFDEEDRRIRDSLMETVCKRSQTVVLSSRSASRDFEEFFPDFSSKVRVLPFPSLLWSASLQDPRPVVEKYHLPGQYALIANQFWKHKNHRILPEALSILKASRMSMNFVLTGLPCDYRDPTNAHLSNFLQECSLWNVRDHIVLLGQTPYADMVDIMRSAAVVVQPSFFEGWSTSIEDCKALGRPLICSDIPVHREQAPHAVAFFDPNQPTALADALRLFCLNESAGLSPSENESLENARNRAMDYGLNLVKIAREASSTFDPAAMDSSPSFLSHAPMSPAEELEKLRTDAQEQREYIHELEVACAERLSALEAVSTELDQKEKMLQDLVAHPVKNLLMHGLRSKGEKL